MAILVFAMCWILLLTCAPSVILAMPRFDATATMQNVLVPADAAVGAVIYRIRATDTNYDFPLDFVLEGDNTVVSLETLNCSRFNSLCQANVLLQKKLIAGRFYDFIVALRNPKGMTIRMGCSFRATNATTPVADIFPGAPSLLKVSEAAKRNSELGTLIARGNPNRQRAVLLELWGSPLFGLRQRLINERDAEATVVLVGPLDYEMQSSYHLTVLANDAWTEPGNDTRNIASWPLLIAILDEQDTPPVFTVAPPVTILDPTLKPGDLILQVHAEDGDRGNPRDVRYGLVSEGNPFTPFFNLSDDKGELRLARPLADIQAISHAGTPVVLTVVAEEIRVSASESPALSTSVQIALIPPVPSWTSPHFSSPIFSTTLDENSAPGTELNLFNPEIIGEPGEVITLELANNNGTFDISPTVIEGRGKFTVTVRDSNLLDFEERRSVQCELVAKQLGNDNNTISASLIVMLNDINDTPPTFLKSEWHASILENAEIGTSVLKIEAVDPNSKSGDHVRFIHLLGPNNQSFRLNPTSGLISVAEPLDAERVSKFKFMVEVADEDGKGLNATTSVAIDLIDVNDEPPRFEKDVYEFILDADKKSFTTPAVIKAIDLDITPPNNVIHYELVTKIENVTLNRDTGELLIRPIWKDTDIAVIKARAWDEGVPRLWGECEIRLYPPESRNRVITFIVPGHDPDPKAIEKELRAVTGAQVTVREVRPYVGKDDGYAGGPRSQVVATVTYGPDTVVDVERIQQIYDRRSHEEIREAGIAWPWWILIVLLILLLIIALILICCCVCAPCPLYMPPRKRKVGSAEVAKLIVHGSGHGVSTKSVQVAEWFGRREAWTPEGVMVDTEVDSLRRHEFERGSDRGVPRRLINKGQLTKEEPREQLYIREGNADILRLITRGGEQQRPTTLVEQSVIADNGKDILMRRFIDQQQTTSRTTAAVNLPNEVNRTQFDQEQLEATLRQQNNLLRQILMERERELRLETQSLPAGTQTDRDAFTQTEPRYLRPAIRLTRSDNDASDVSDEEEIIVTRKRTKQWPARRKNNVPLRRRIRTPIQEESESNVESVEIQQKEASTSSTIDKLRVKVLRELLNEGSAKSRPTRSAIRKEVLREIAESLVHSEESVSDNELYRDRKKRKRYKRQFSDDSLENMSSSPEGAEAGDDTNLNQSQKYHSESDLRVVTNGDQIKETKSASQTDVSKTPKPKAKGLKMGRKGSRYMEWYTKSQSTSTSSKKATEKEKEKEKEKEREKEKEKEREKEINVQKPGTSGVTARQVAAEAKVQKKKTAAATSESAAQTGSKAGPEHPLIQHSKHRFETPLSTRRADDDADSGIALARPAMAEKKSVFSIAYEDIQRQTRQLRPESSTTP